MAAYNFARRLKILSDLTPSEYICKVWTSEPNRFILNPIQQMPGLNKPPVPKIPGRNLPRHRHDGKPGSNTQAISDAFQNRLIPLLTLAMNENK